MKNDKVCVCLLQHGWLDGINNRTSTVPGIVFCTEQIYNNGVFNEVAVKETKIAAENKPRNESRFREHTIMKWIFARDVEIINLSVVFNRIRCW